MISHAWAAAKEIVEPDGGAAFGRIMSHIWRDVITERIVVQAAFNAGMLVAAFLIGFRRLKREVAGLKRFRAWAQQKIQGLERYHEINHPGQHVIVEDVGTDDLPRTESGD